MSHSSQDYENYENYDDASTSVPSSVSRASSRASASSHSSRHSSRSRKLIVPPERQATHCDVYESKHMPEKKMSKRVSNFLSQQKQIDEQAFTEKYPSHPHKKRSKKYDELYVYGDPSEIVISSGPHKIAVKSHSKFSLELQASKLTFHGNQHF